MTENRADQPNLDHELNSSSEEVQKWYYKFLGQRRTELTKAQGGYANVSTEERLGILEKARRRVFFGNADPEKMKRDWNKYDKREPVGGAQTDKND